MKRHLLLCAATAFLPLLAGCPEETEPNPTPQSPLEPPAKGEGFQFGTGPQVVAAGDEVQNCYFFKVSDLLEQGGLDPTQPLNLHHVEIFQTEGSHHMNIFKVNTVGEGADALIPEQGPYINKNGVGACFKSPNWADWPLIANTQQDGTLDWEFPEGVANVLQPDDWIMLQSHYVNATTQDTPEDSGEVLVNFRHLPQDQMQYEMGTLFATNQNIRICQSLPEPTFQKGCQFNSDEPVTVVGANGHFHSRGKKFEIYNWDGVSFESPAESSMFYKSDVWDEPPMSIGDSLAKIPANGGIFYTCDFQWTQPEEAVGCQGLNDYDVMKNMTPEDQLDCCYTFGGIVEKNEHCNAFVYYYPKVDNITCQ